MSVLEEVLSANETYAAGFGEKSQLSLPPARGFAILTCMDARLDPAKYAGLSEGDAPPAQLLNPSAVTSLHGMSPSSVFST